ncbi:MAG: tol-pal system YbgF family protein, partial [Sulfuricurvum sp.]
PPQVIKVPELSNSMTAAGAVSAPSDKSLSINRNESKLDIEGLQRRFKETSNANLGLFIARYYYDQGNFNEAYNYALRTNTLNSKIDESWLIFSKSLVKLGKSDQAKKTLQLYISQSGSETAKILLDSIEKGNFK